MGSFPRSVLAAVAPAACTVAIVLISPGALAECRLTAGHANLSGVVVSAGPTTFSLDVAGSPVEIVLAPNAAMARVDVIAPLRFGAQFPADKLDLRLKTPVELYGGRVRLGRRTAHVRLGVEDDAIRVSLRETFEVDVPRGLSVPCRLLGLHDGVFFSTPPDDEPAGSQHVAIGPGLVPMFERPVAVDPLELAYPGPFAVRGRRPGWILVEASWGDGTRLKGWVRQTDANAELTPWSGRGEPAHGREGGCAVTDEVLTRMTIRKAAPIAASAAGVVWAHAAKTVAVEVFPHEPADGAWISIATMRGLPSRPCARHQHMWVHARDVLNDRDGSLDSLVDPNEDRATKK